MHWKMLKYTDWGKNARARSIRVQRPRSGIGPNRLWVCACNSKGKTEQKLGRLGLEPQTPRMDSGCASHWASYVFMMTREIGRGKAICASRPGQKLKREHGDSPATGASSNPCCGCRGPAGVRKRARVRVVEQRREGVGACARPSLTGHGFRLEG